MYKYMYSEINALCIIVLGYVLYKLRASGDQQTNVIVFRRLVVAVIGILVLDNLWVIVEGQPGAFMRYINMLTNCVYMSQTGLITYLWLRFSIGKFNIPARFTWQQQFALEIPLFALAVLSFTSPLTGWIFYLDENNVYHRGPFHTAQMVIALFYMLLSAYYTLLAVRRAKTHRSRQEASATLVLFALPISCTLLGKAFYGLPVTWPSAALTILMVYINLREEQISTDDLTGLNNRRQFDMRISALAQDVHRAERLTLLMMDINDFKRINDTYGHLEGDSALAETGEILRQVCRGREVFLARYGGDEFAALCTFDEYKQALTLREDIRQAFAARNRDETTAYDITLSIGIAECVPGHDDPVTHLIRQADNALYAEKAAQRAAAAGKR